MAVSDATGAPGDTSLVHLSFGEGQRPVPGMLLQLLNTEALPEGPAPVRMSRFELVAGARSPLDTHEERELWIIAEGTGTLEYRGEHTIPVRAGDVLAFERHASHTLRNTGQLGLVVFSVWWMDGAHG
jgi:mannose-6-phosphate isomerase-like protein (cupin superfamily)